jgi:hypothetical protein
VVAVALEHLAANPEVVVNWQHLLTTSYSSPVAETGRGGNRRSSLVVAGCRTMP